MVVVVVEDYQLNSSPSDRGLLVSQQSCFLIPACPAPLEGWTNDNSLIYNHNFTIYIVTANSFMAAWLNIVLLCFPALKRTISICIEVVVCKYCKVTLQAARNVYSVEWMPGLTHYKERSRCVPDIGDYWGDQNMIPAYDAQGTLSSDVNRSGSLFRDEAREQKQMVRCCILRLSVVYKNST